MKAQFGKASPLPAFVLLMLFLGSHGAAAGPPEACSLLSPSEVAKITGDEAPIFSKTVQPKGSVCVYAAKRSPNTTADVNIMLFESAAKAQEVLKQLSDLESYKKLKLLKPGDTIESDKVAGMPAVFQLVQGVARMFVVKGNMIIAAGVNRVWSDGKMQPDRARSRLLLAAAVGKL
jgi:hypothetical protein